MWEVLLYCRSSIGSPSVKEVRCRAFPLETPAFKMRILKPAVQYFLTPDGGEEPISTDCGRFERSTSTPMSTNSMAPSDYPSPFCSPPLFPLSSSFGSPDGGVFSLSTAGISDASSASFSSDSSAFSPQSSPHQLLQLLQQNSPRPLLHQEQRQFAPPHPQFAEPYQQHHQQQQQQQPSKSWSIPPATSFSAPPPAALLLPNDVLQRRGRAEDPFLPPANAVEASYWNELRRLFPSMPSSGRCGKSRASSGGGFDGGSPPPGSRRESFVGGDDGAHWPPLPGSDGMRGSPMLTPPSSPLPPPHFFKLTHDEFVSRMRETERCCSSVVYPPPSESGFCGSASVEDGPSPPPPPPPPAAEATLLTGLEQFMRPLAMQTETKLFMARLDLVVKSFEKNGSAVLFDEIDAKLMQNRRALLGLPEDDFFDRSVVVADMIRPSQRLGIDSKEAWSQFRRQSESSSPEHAIVAWTVENDDAADHSRKNRPGRRPPRPRKSTSLSSVGSGGGGGRKEVPDASMGAGKKCNFCFNNKEPIEVKNIVSVSWKAIPL